MTDQSRAVTLTNGMIVLLLGLLCVPGQAAVSAPVKTPRANELILDQVTSDSVMFVVAVSTADPNARWGWFAACNRREGSVQAGFSFGGFPSNGQTLQVGIRGPDGNVERFGRAFRSPEPTSGYHDPVFDERATVARIVRSAFVRGALVSNGFNSVWNELPAETNRRVRTEFLRCAGSRR